MQEKNLNELLRRENMTGNTILRQIKESLSSGGEFLLFEKDEKTGLWTVLVMSGTYVYYSYTVGRNNAYFVFDLLEFCYQSRIEVQVERR